MRFSRTTISCVCAQFFFAATLSSAQPLTPGIRFPLQARWKATLDSSPVFPPAFDSDRAYVALSNKRLVSIHLKDGAIAWAVDVSTNAPPAAGGGLVFVAEKGAIEARAQADGLVRWRRPAEGAVRSLHWDTGWLAVETETGTLLMLRAADGELLWQRELGTVTSVSPVLAGERVYLGLKDGRFLAVALRDGTDIWSRSFKDAAAGVLPLVDRVYVGSLDNFFYCLDATDGDVEWRWPTGGDLLGAPAIDGRRVYFVALDNVLRAHDRSNGTMLWQTVLPARPSTGPLLSGGTLIVAGVATELYSFATLDGNAGGDFVFKGTEGEEMQLAAPPHVTAGDLLILTTKSGQVHALTGTTP